MLLKTIAQKVDIVLTKKEQNKVKGGNVEWGIITDLDVM